MVEAAQPQNPQSRLRRTSPTRRELCREKGIKALRENDYGEAADCLSRALEIRVARYGELALECVNSYYQYGRALLYKAQEEADALAIVPKKEGDTPKESDKAGSIEDVPNGESSVASNVAQNVGLNPRKEFQMMDSDAEDLAEADEDESDLDFAWKMLDVAREITQKQPGDTMDKVDILSALAEVALERDVDLAVKLLSLQPIDHGSLLHRVKAAYMLPFYDPASTAGVLCMRGFLVLGSHNRRSPSGDEIYVPYFVVGVNNACLYFIVGSLFLVSHVEDIELL
ncbi:hypothetical protein HS088_TW13G01079 [Tripterygium wilfordii]|uniref:Uncharacterized protein n=1 Tax=Tripterygium wilfordii TaxID=458696 RepID=A0A7J7CVY2_TRIWF|nr:hypothetical protein HS088_TW13G01079 [Tripterygium wilfordii]